MYQLTLESYLKTFFIDSINCKIIKEKFFKHHNAEVAVEDNPKLFKAK